MIKARLNYKKNLQSFEHLSKVAASLTEQEMGKNKKYAQLV